MFQVDLALDVEDLMSKIPSIFRIFNKKLKIDTVYPNQNISWWHTLSDFLFHGSESKSKKKSKIGDLRAPLVSSYVLNHSEFE